MVKVRIIRSGNGSYRGFESEGHAGFDAYGKDFVCGRAFVPIINT